MRRSVRLRTFKDRVSCARSVLTGSALHAIRLLRTVWAKEVERRQELSSRAGGMTTLSQSRSVRNARADSEKSDVCCQLEKIIG